mgnify:CR=1 FL=1
MFKRKNLVQEFEFEKPKGSRFWEPVRVEVRCLTNSCAYSLKIQPIFNRTTDSKDKNGNVIKKLEEHVLKKGHPTFLYIKPSSIICFKGHISGKD